MINGYQSAPKTTLQIIRHRKTLLNFFKTKLQYECDNDSDSIEGIDLNNNGLVAIMYVCGNNARRGESEWAGIYDLKNNKCIKSFKNAYKYVKFVTLNENAFIAITEKNFAIDIDHTIRIYNNKGGQICKDYVSDLYNVFAINKNILCLKGMDSPNTEYKLYNHKLQMIKFKNDNLDTILSGSNVLNIHKLPNNNLGFFTLKNGVESSNNKGKVDIEHYTWTQNGTLTKNVIKYNCKYPNKRYKQPGGYVFNQLPNKIRSILMLLPMKSVDSIGSATENINALHTDFKFFSTKSGDVCAFSIKREGVFLYNPQKNTCTPLSFNLDFKGKIPHIFMFSLNSKLVIIGIALASKDNYLFYKYNINLCEKIASFYIASGRINKEFKDFKEACEYKERILKSQGRENRLNFLQQHTKCLCIDFSKDDLCYMRIESKNQNTTDFFQQSSPMLQNGKGKKNGFVMDKNYIY